MSSGPTRLTRGARPTVRFTPVRDNRYITNSNNLSLLRVIKKFVGFGEHFPFKAIDGRFFIKVRYHCG
jgi:hypothetical protein